MYTVYSYSFMVNL